MDETAFFDLDEDLLGIDYYGDAIPKKKNDATSKTTKKYVFSYAGKLEDREFLYRLYKGENGYGNQIVYYVSKKLSNDGITFIVSKSGMRIYLYDGFVERCMRTNSGHQYIPDVTYFLPDEAKEYIAKFVLPIKEQIDKHEGLRNSLREHQMFC